MSKRKGREVIDGDLQGPLSWDETYDQFLRLPIAAFMAIGPLLSSATGLRQR
jgi:hypothetical protein